MILDTLDARARYLGLHRAFAAAFQFLARPDLATLAPGRHVIDGDNLYVSIDHKDGRGRDSARLESHRRYIDIQLTIEGDEEIGRFAIFFPEDAHAPLAGRGLLRKAIAKVATPGSP